MSSTPDRRIALVVNRWPVHAFLRTRAQESGTSEGLPEAVAVTYRGRVLAASEAAERSGVVPGLRPAEAMAREKALLLAPHDPFAASARFHELVQALSELVVGLEIHEPGVCSVAARGPSRYYGGEAAAMHRLEVACNVQGLQARIGCGANWAVAVLAARTQAARVANTDTREFLRSLPLSLAAPAPIERFCADLGLHTLGAFGELPESTALNRWGMAGVRIWRLSRGLLPCSTPIPLPFLADASSSTETRAQKDITNSAALDAQIRSRAHTVIPFSEGLQHSEAIGFACKDPIDSFVATLNEYGAVATSVRITLHTEGGLSHRHVWQHPEFFTTTDLVHRVRWQAEQQALEHRDTSASLVGLAGPSDWEALTGVEIELLHWNRAIEYAPALWSTGAPQRLTHQLTRLQSLLGLSAVCVPALTGGRLLHERAALNPWGVTQTGQDHAPRASARRDTPAERRSEHPWPGALPSPRPATVFSPPQAAQLLTARGTPVRVDHNDLLSGTPATLNTVQVLHWSAPWPIRERWWADVPDTHRLQVTLQDGSAWLLLHRSEQWFAEGRYD